MSDDRPRDIRDVRRWLRDDALRRGKARPRTMREWEVWNAGLRDRLGHAFSREQTKKATGEAPDGP